MIHKKIKIRTKGSGEDAYISTYFIEPTEQITRTKKPCVVLCPGGAYAFTSDREAEPVALRFLAQGIHVVILRYSVAPSVFPAALLELIKLSPWAFPPAAIWWPATAISGEPSR